MALSLSRRALEKTLPSAQAVRKTLEDYLSRTGLNYLDFATRINYSKVAIAKFMRGAYGGSDAGLRSDILQYIATHPIAVYESVTGTLYRTSNFKILEEVFLDAVENRRFSVVEGDPGTQKTFIISWLIAELNKRELSKNGHGRRAYHVYCPQGARPNGLLKEIAETVGSLVAGDNRRVIRNLAHEFGPRHVTLFLDEAQHLDPPCMEVMRQLYDRPPYCSVIFVGSHGFGHILDARAVKLEQLNSRIHSRHSLPGLSEREVETIVKGELGDGAGKQVVDLVVANSTVERIRSAKGEKYISARRVFDQIATQKAKRAKKAKAGAA